MASLRIDGFKFNPANWASMSTNEQSTCRQHATRRERELNTFDMVAHQCHGGPFAGQRIELDATTKNTAPLSVGAWAGQYQMTTQKDNEPDRLEWVGNHGGAPVNAGTPASERSKTAKELPARGFEQLADLLGELAADPAERAEATPIGPMARYTIGRTTYTIQATQDAADKIRARIIKAKKWFSDKLLTEAKPAETTAPADAIAMASASLAIGKAQATAASTSQAKETETETADAIGEELATVDACEAAAETTATAAPMAANSAGSCTPAPSTARATINSTKTTADRIAQGQQINSKSGEWSAVFFLDERGAPSMEFEGPDGGREVLNFSNGSERMQALQTMARRAADQAQGTEEEPNETTPHSAQDAQRLAAQCEGFTPEQCEFTAQQFEATNHHGAALMWRCMGLGAFDLAARAKATIETQDRAGQLTPALGEQRAAIAAELRTREDQQRQTMRGYTQALKTQGPTTDGGNPNPVETPNSGGLSILIERWEGPSDECGQPVTVGSFAEVDTILMQWSETAPAHGGYDKCGYSVTWPNGNTDSGRLDLVHHTIQKPSLGDELANDAEFALGKHCPLHMSQTKYSQCIDTSEDAQAPHLAMLARLATHAGYFPRVHPISCPDMLALAAHLAIEPAQLVGLGVVTYSPDSGRTKTGAITSAEVRTMGSYKALVLITTYETGEVEHMDATSFKDQPGERFSRSRLDMRGHGAPYLAQLAAAATSAKASNSAAKEREALAHQQAKDRLQAENPALKTHAQAQSEGGKLSGCTLAAWNLRQLLKINFPGVKFSVKTSTFSMGDSINVKWQDGPTEKAVDAIANQFSGGSFDSQDDSYTYTSTAFSELYGSTKYMNTSRSLSDQAIATLIAQEFPTEATRPTVEDYRRGKIRDHAGRCPIYIASREWAAPAPAAATKPAKSKTQS